MNEIEKTEDLLRKAPRLKIPNGLRERLVSEITLPGVHANHSPAHYWRRLGRPWLSALSFSAFSLACVAAIAVQSSVLSQLRRENESLRAGIHKLEQLRRAGLEHQALRTANEQLEQFRNDSAELQTLRSEVARLREELQQLPSLRDENRRLVAEKTLAETRLAPQAQPAEDPFAVAKNKAQRIECINNLKQIGLAARLWAIGHNDVFPAAFLVMTNKLSSPRLLVCPGDTNRLVALNWSELGPANISYELLSPGASEEEPAVVYVRCPIHNNVGLVDGSAQMIESNVTITQRDGKWVLARNPLEKN